MILFYNKKDGKIFATIDGRVHDERHLKCHINSGKEEVGKFIIGWIEKGKDKIEYNIDQFKTLQRFEDSTPTSPLDYKIYNGKLIKK